VSSLPAGIENLSRLRILNISENSFESLPFARLAKLPLTEILARKNKISGTLIEDSVDSLPNLQSLDVSCNRLTGLVAPESTIRLPSLHQLTLSMNRIQALPDVSSWKSLLTLTLDENSISAVPDGFTSLDKLRHADFSSNDIRVIPPEIARMDNLAMIRLTGNPLRDKKFSSITTEDLKDILATRLEPPPPYQDVERNVRPVPAVSHILENPKVLEVTQEAVTVEATSPVAIHEADEDSRSDMDDFATPPTSAPNSPARSRSHTISNQTYTVKNGGVLDRSSTESSSLHPVICSRLAAEVTVREVQLHHNLFASLPNSLSFFASGLTALSLAHNQLVGESYLTEELELPALRELNLVSNHITSLAPLMTFLHAPNLEKIDVSFNRVTTIPNGLRTSFPKLSVLLASNNHLVDLDPETIRGMHIVDAGNNDIAHLNPRLGLLGGNGGLQRLEVSGNRFRVPRWSVLERGTEATLRWLRGRVPIAEMGAWREGNGNGNSSDGSSPDTSLADVD
jgi:Leucine-rich repeat (LRR) protein